MNNLSHTRKNLLWNIKVRHYYEGCPFRERSIYWDYLAGIVICGIDGSIARKKSKVAVARKQKTIS